MRRRSEKDSSFWDFKGGDLIKGATVLVAATIVRELIMRAFVNPYLSKVLPVETDYAPAPTASQVVAAVEKELVTPPEAPAEMAVEAPVGESLAGLGALNLFAADASYPIPEWLGDTTPLTKRRIRRQLTAREIQYARQLRAQAPALYSRWLYNAQYPLCAYCPHNWRQMANGGWIDMPGGNRCQMARSPTAVNEVCTAATRGVPQTEEACNAAGMWWGACDPPMPGCPGACYEPGTM